MSKQLTLAETVKNPYMPLFFSFARKKYKILQKMIGSDFPY